jgi:cytochrome c553
MFKLLLTIACLGACVSAHAAGDVERGKTLSYTCLGCHGIDDYKNVYPTYSVPELAGQHPEYIVAALKEYKSGERSHLTMHQQATSLSDQDMEDIASYFATGVVKAGGTPVGTAPDKVAQLCSACHGKDGVGITGAYPTLSGQHGDYLQRALEEYQRGDRKNDVMPNFMRGLTQDDMAAIAAYYAKQSPPLRTLPRRLSILSPQ